MRKVVSRTQNARFNGRSSASMARLDEITSLKDSTTDAVVARHPRRTRKSFVVRRWMFERGFQRRLDTGWSTSARNILSDYPRHPPRARPTLVHAKLSQAMIVSLRKGSGVTVETRSETPLAYVRPDSVRALRLAPYIKTWRNVAVVIRPAHSVTRVYNLPCLV